MVFDLIVETWLRNSIELSELKINESFGRINYVECSCFFHAYLWRKKVLDKNLLEAL